MSLFLISFISADCSLPNPFKQYQEGQLTGSCSNCTYNNLTKIIDSDNTIRLLGQYEMTKNDTNYNYSYTFDKSGNWYYTYEGDLNGITTTQTCSVEVSPSGQSGTSNMFLFVIVFVLFYGLIIFGIKIKNPWISLIGCICLAGIGVYTSIYGVDLYRNNLTTLISYANIAIGLGIGFDALRDITNL
jgi:hypothetical protein